MKRLCTKHCLLAVISLVLSVIWHLPAVAAVAPTVQFLGEWRDGVPPGARLDVDAEGSLYLVNALKKEIVKLDKYGRVARIYKGFPSFANGIAVTADGSRLYVAGYDTVYVVDGASGAIVGKLASAEHPDGVGEFITVGEIDMDASGYVYVVDGAGVRIKVYGPDNLFKYQFGGLGILYGSGQLGFGKFRSIWALTVDKYNKEVYVADNQNFSRYYSQIQIFGLDGVYRRSMTQQSFGVPPLSMFAGMEFDNSGRGYFIDSMRGEIRVRNLPAGIFPTFGVGGYNYGELVSPYDMVYDPLTRRLFVSNVDAAKVLVYGIDAYENPDPPKSNTAPGVPVVSLPSSDSLVASQNPVLSWQNAVDEDADVLTYEVRVMKDAAVVYEQAGIAESAGGSEVTVATALEENTRFEWQVRANDGQAVSDWSAVGSFYVNAVNEPPTVVGLTAPLAEMSLDGSGHFIWTDATDPDPFDTLSYRLEVSVDADFASPVIAAETDALDALLGHQDGYAGLVDGQVYFWRVLAVDAQGAASASEARSFVYDTTMLTVRANMPGAKVYLGGNLAYPGHYLGMAPVELRDIAPGTMSVVVERSGFEPQVLQVTVAQGESGGLYAALRPAVAPADHKASALASAGVKIELGANAAPFAVDFDNDGLIDLLAADATGALTLYPGLEGSQPAFDLGRVLAVKVPAGSSPVVVDWNNDGMKDLLVGTGTGEVLLYLNTGSETAPVFGEGVAITSAGAAIGVGSFAAPAVLDLDNDGDKDLLVGSSSGSVFAFRNDGSDAAPELVSIPSPVPVLSDNSAPCVTDWNADGVKDLLLATTQHLFVCVGQGGGFAPIAVLAVAEDLTGKSNGKSTSGANYLGERLRVVAYDVDGAKGKDLIIGNAAGQVRFARSNGSLKAYVPAFSPALADKFAQVRASVDPALVDALLVLDQAEQLALGALANGKPLPLEAYNAVLAFTATGGLTVETIAQAQELAALLQ